jgi:hypothetical protein
MRRSSNSAWRVAAAGLLCVGLGGCRGWVSRDPPVHLNDNMDVQERFGPQAKNPFFRDNRAMRPEVPGTVAVGELREDDHLHRGVIGGQVAQTLPPSLRLDRPFAERGRERFDIYCSPCHDRAGNGEGIVVKRGMAPPPAFGQPRLRAMPVGQIYSVIAAGVRSMPRYAEQIPVVDRWAIVAHVRSLQLVRTATSHDVAGPRGRK